MFVFVHSSCAFGLHYSFQNKKIKDASRWSSFDVQIWLAQSGFAAYVGVFRDNDVNGKLLLKLDAGTLRDDFGINVPEDRERLLTAVSDDTARNRLTNNCDQDNIAAKGASSFQCGRLE